MYTASCRMSSCRMCCSGRASDSWRMGGEDAKCDWHWRGHRHGRLDVSSLPSNVVPRRQLSDFSLWAPVSAGFMRLASKWSVSTSCKMADDWGRAGSQVLTPLSSISSSKALQRSQGEGMLPAANGRARCDQGAASDRRSDVATWWEQSTLVWQGRDADSSPTHHEENYLGCRFTARANFYLFRPPRRHDRSKHIRANGNAANEEGSVVVDGSYGALSARRRSGKARCANETHQAPCKTSERNVCQNENARLVRMERP